MNRITLLLLLLVPLYSYKGDHKFYVSVTQVDYSSEKQTLQIISRIFIDDIEEALRERYDKSIELSAYPENNQIDIYLNKYITQKLNISVNSKKVSFTFIGKEYLNDLMLCYLEIKNIASLNSIEVSNKILMDLFEEQQNIIHVKKSKQRKSLLLRNGKDKDVLNF